MALSSERTSTIPIQIISIGYPTWNFALRLAFNLLDYLPFGRSTRLPWLFAWPARIIYLSLFPDSIITNLFNIGFYLQPLSLMFTICI